MEHSQLVDAFSEFKDLKNIDRASMMSILEDVFRGMIKKKYGTADNFDIVIRSRTNQATPLLTSDDVLPLLPAGSRW